MSCSVEFLTVKARDTFAYDDITFDFTNGIHSICGSNGEGKSSLFLAVVQGLFNRNPKGGKIDEINNTVTGGLSEITVEFRKGADIYRVVNSRKSGKIEVFKNGGERSIAPKGIAASLKLIEEILGVSYDTFVELTYRNSHSSLALVEESGDSARKAFLGRILRFEELDRLHGVAKDRVKEYEKEAQILERNIGHMENSVIELKPVEPKYDTKIIEFGIEVVEDELRRREKINNAIEVELASFQEKLPAAVKASKARERTEVVEAALKRFDSPFESLEQAEDQLQTLRHEELHLEQDLAAQKEIERIRNRRLDLLGKLSKVPEPLISYEGAEKLNRQVEQAIDATSNAIKQASDTLQRLAGQEPLEVCPTCGAAMDNDKARELYEAEKQAAEHQLAEAQEEMPEIRKALKDSREMVEAHKERSYLLRELELVVDPVLTVDPDELAEREAKLPGALEQAQKEVHKHRYKKDLEHELEVLKATPELEADPSAIEARILSLNATLRDGLSNSDALKNTLRDKKTDLTYKLNHNTIQATCEAFNKEASANNKQLSEQIAELKQQVKDAVRKKALAERWVGILGKNGYRLHQLHRFLLLLNETLQKYTQMISDGRITCQFFLTEDGKVDFKVTDADKSLPYSMWSDGEKARVKLSCLFAVLELLESVEGTGFNLLFLDEVFASLDEAGREGLFRILAYLRDSGKSIYTIAHSPIANAVVFDSTIWARKVNGLATIQRMTAYGQTAIDRKGAAQVSAASAPNVGAAA